MKPFYRIVFACLLFCVIFFNLPAQLSGTRIMTREEQSPSRLAVVWTSGDPEVALNSCFMYTHNAKKRGWFDEVVLIVWGPSARLTAEDDTIQREIQKMGTDGVLLQACRACTDRYGVTKKLETLGIEVKYIGVPLTEMLQSDWKVLTF